MRPPGRTARVLPTRYGGIKFRSRTEARFAVFLDALQVSYEYEPEGYHLGHLNYLPDFFIRSWDLYLEVKGTPPTPDEIAKARMLVGATQKKILLVIGDPGQRNGLLFLPAAADAPGIPTAFPAVCRHCSALVLTYRYGDHGHGCLPISGPCGAPDRCGDHFTTYGAGLEIAIDAARTHRFDRKKSR